jgi:two-component system sensor histidine kinase AlgZ
LFNSGFDVEFDKGRFPLRFCLTTFAITLIALIFYYGANQGSNYSLSHLVSVLVLISSFCAISLGLLFVLQKSIRKMGLKQGFVFSWFVVVVVTICMSLALIFAKELQNFGISLFNTQYFTPAMGYSLILFSFIFTPGVLWFEKRLYSDRAAQIASESEQYTNLDFRIRPHFLFNSLNSVAGLITQQPSRAETALYNLADVFRAVMSDKRQLVPLKAELDMADKYLYLEKIRLGDRLEVSSKIDPNSLGVKVPVFLLQPMLENAVYHGVETRFKGGKISLVIQVKDNKLLIKITNPLPEAGVKRHVGNRVAQQNLRQRIHAVFGNKASLDSYEAETTFNVIARIPL